LKELAVVFCAAGCADCAAEVTVQLEGGDGRVGLWMEGIDVCCVSVVLSTNFRVGCVTLSNDTRQISHTSQIRHCLVRSIRLGLVQIRPSQKTSRPVPFSRRMICDEFVKVNRSVGFVECISAFCASVVC
jgi:hypothetical protein